MSQAHSARHLVADMLCCGTLVSSAGLVWLAWWKRIWSEKVMVIKLHTKLARNRKW